MYSNIVSSSNSSIKSNSNYITSNGSTAGTSNTPLVVRTSKQWVLPPRPKPGRKPVSGKDSKENTSSHSSSTPSPTGPSIGATKQTDRRKKWSKKSTSPTDDINDIYPSVNAVSSINNGVRKQTSISPSKPLASSSTASHSIHTDHLNQPPRSNFIPISTSVKTNALSASALNNGTFSNGCNADTTNSVIMSSLAKNVRVIDAENLSLKSHLLSLIHEYKHLKDLVLNHEVPIADLEEADELDKNVHKRSYTEIEIKEQHERDGDDSIDTGLKNQAIAPQNNIINEINETTIDELETFITYDAVPVNTTTSTKSSKKKRTHKKFAHYKDFEKLDTVEDSDMEIDFEDEDEDDIDSPSSSGLLSRTTSPSSDFESNSLMSTLTRSTTVSSINTTTQFPLLDKKSGYPFKIGRNNFFELPKYEEEDLGDYQFKFDDAMNTPSTLQSSLPSDQDQYNMINDFLEEKLLNNDFHYYVENDNNDDMKW
ncbi:uncharacterized protein RJT20DRAFT_124547 [Scheffersomyces xylosifermentans]|uniref:uncharacterized protein n=1 Tax=Scheffersomyces xylosifermentans TaxID=1304137 RepID=UPI00315C87D6